jgi:hypothetical protein
MNLTNTKIKPDYEGRSYERIYKKFGRECVSSEGVDLLHCGPAFQPLHEDDNVSWPSWIPDWSQKPLFTSFLTMKAFSAGSRLTPQLHLVSPRKLSVRGRGFDDYSITIMRFRRRVPTRLEKVHTWVAELMSKFNENSPRDTLRTLAVTLVADGSHVMPLKSRQEGFEPGDEEFRDRRNRAQYTEGFSDLLGYADGARGRSQASKPFSDSKKAKYSPAARKYAQLIQVTMEGRRFFRMLSQDSSYFGIGPTKMRDSDLIAVFDGGRTPFVLRPNMEKGHFRLVGDCYISGMMKGEALDLGLRRRDFCLV